MFKLRAIFGSMIHYKHKMIPWIYTFNEKEKCTYEAMTLIELTEKQKNKSLKHFEFPAQSIYYNKKGILYLYDNDDLLTDECLEKIHVFIFGHIIECISDPHYYVSLMYLQMPHYIEKLKRILNINFKIGNYTEHYSMGYIMQMKKECTAHDKEKFVSYVDNKKISKILAIAIDESFIIEETMKTTYDPAELLNQQILFDLILNRNKKDKDDIEKNNENDYRIINPLLLCPQ